MNVRIFYTIALLIEKETVCYFLVASTVMRWQVAALRNAHLQMVML